MEGNLSALHRSLFQGGLESETDGRDLFLVGHRHDSELIKLGLHDLLLTLTVALSTGSASSKLNYQLWTETQVESVVSLGLAIISALRPSPPEQVEPVAVAVVQRFLDFALCYLENSEFGGDELHAQNHALSIMELACNSGLDTTRLCVSGSCTLSSLEEVWLMVSCESNEGKVDAYGTWDLHGFNCSITGRSVDRHLMSFASELYHFERQDFEFYVSSEKPDDFMTLCQRWAVVKLDCIKRLITCSRKVFPVSDSSDRMDPDKFKRLSFVLRIYQLVRKVSEKQPWVDYDTSLIEEVAACTNLISCMLKNDAESFNNVNVAEGNLENIQLLLVEEFLCFVRVIFCGSNAAQNIEACIASSMIGHLGTSLGVYEKSTHNLRSLLHFPRTVIYMFKLIKDLRRQCKITGYLPSTGDAVGTSSDGISCNAHERKVQILNFYSEEELLEIIFTSSTNWLQNLLCLLDHLHSEGLKLLQRVEKSNSNVIKPLVSFNSESTVTTDDEALFGDLFSEGNRPAVAIDDQVNVADSCSSITNTPMQAACELLNFLKDCVFSREWSSSLFADACTRLQENHVDILLSVLQSNVYHTDAKSSDSRVLSCDGKRVLHIQGLCYDLLHKLIMYHAFTDYLEEYLVTEIVKVEKGKFVYNKHALCLLTYAIASRKGSSGSKLRFRLYKTFVDFVNAKAKIVYSEVTSVKEFASSLPSLFHVEILLMAFHLSSDTEKVTFAGIVFEALQQADSSSKTIPISQLSCWALVISRLIILLRHMLAYAQCCPSSLLVSLKSKWREMPNSSLGHSKIAHDHLISWFSIAMKTLSEPLLEEEPILRSLVGWLVDDLALPLYYLDELDSEFLQLNLNNVVVTFFNILGLWKGRKASEVEDLLVERYIFSLCSDIHAAFPSGYQLFLESSRACDFSDVRFFLMLGSSFFGLKSDIKGTHLLEMVIELLQHLCASDFSESFEDLGWDFLRNGAWVSFVISLFNIGITKYCNKSYLTDANLYWIEKSTNDHCLISCAESLASSLIQTGGIPMLLRLLSSLLRTYLKVYRIAYIATMGSGCSDTSAVASLLKHCSFDGCEQNEFVKKSAVKISQLKSVLETLSKLRGLIDRGSPGVVTQISRECSLHGFSTLRETSCAILVSCIVCIKGYISVLAKFCGVEEWRNGFDGMVLQDIVESTMIVKFDTVYKSLHGECDSIIANISGVLEPAHVENIYLLKQMGELLSDFSEMKFGDSWVLEHLLLKIIDTATLLKQTPLESNASNFIGEGKNVLESYCSQESNLVLLLNSLDHCYSESMNVKVLNFFVDILSEHFSPSLREKIEKKFLDKNLLDLSKWLKSRLLGLEHESGAQCSQGSSLTLRDTTNKFVLSITSFPSQYQTQLQEHFFGALLMLLDDAFLEFDIYIAMTYFHFVVQLATRLPLMRLLLIKILELMEKLSSDERLLPGLKILFTFLGNVLNGRGSLKYTSGKAPGKPFSAVGSDAGTTTVTSVGSRRNSETLALTTGREAGPANNDCDATSPDEDEDDGTSDGEVASMDKDEEEDSNSEKALASKVCTFTSSGSNFMEQHWYFCYTCDLTVSKGCCSICAKVCHYGHRVVYSRSSRFFCDCGEGGVRGSSCQCLKPRKYTGSDKGRSHFPNNMQTLLPFSEEPDHLPESDSDFDEEVVCDTDNSISFNIFSELQDQIVSLFEELDVEVRVLQLCSSLLPSIIRKKETSLSQDKKVVLGEDKVLNYGLEMFQLKKAYKGGSFDLKVKTEYSNAKELRSHLASGSLTKSLLSVSNRGRLAIGEGDKIAIYDVGQLIGQASIAPVTADKNNVKPVSKNIVRFEIVHLAFNTTSDNYLAVAGYEDCQVLTLSPRGEVIDRLAIELVLQGGYIRRIDWVPGSQVKLMVVTNKFIKIYDLSQDNISPLHYFTLSDNMIADATIVTASQGRMFLIFLSENGCLFRLELTVEGVVGVTLLKDAIKVQCEKINAKGCSLFFSASLKILFVSFEDGTTLMCRPNNDLTSVSDSSYIYEEQDGNITSSSLHRWRELLPGSGIFACFAGTKSNSAYIVLLEPHRLHAQNVRCTLGSSASHLVGLSSYKPLSKDKVHCLALYDDGSLQIYSHVPTGADAGANITAEKVKTLGSGILNSKAYTGVKPEFPLDFFEKTVCITADIKLGGDAIRNGDSESAKQSLASEDGFLESPTPSGFKISVSNSNPDIVMVGVRLHVGNTSANHIPSEIAIFQRTIKLDEGMRSWYDLPFTVAESLLADEELVISVGPAFNGTALPRIDSLEIYGRAKDEFGWKEKLDALFHMESRAHGVKSLIGVSEKKCKQRHTSFIPEHVVADGLTVLSALYTMRRLLYDGMNADSIRKCKALLESIFESDREHLLQAAACRVLHSAFPNKERYYQVKDDMRLRGVLKSTSSLLSRLGGGTTTSSIIDEFTAQMRAVSKIALHRRANLSSFLDLNGTEVIDGLMRVLWDILDFENPDTQTMNNIVISSVELVYCYAECLAFNGKEVAAHSVAPAVVLFKKLLFYPNEAVQSSSSLAIASRLLQMPFPKQTLMVTEDHSDSLVSASGTELTTTENAQVLIEEDSITSSVQYCCDGCSTVPILRRRWHCTVCADFDLCESCYQVLEADRLPPPHSRDHPMTAIPIEMDTIGDGTDNSFHTGDANISSSLTSTTDIFQKSSSPIHVLERSYSGGFHTSMSDTVSISASKKAVNSCILSELLEQLKGWMMTTSGHHAIPVMQLFYRLSSATNGPFMNSSKPEPLDLEKLIRWFLDEMNLSQPFVAKFRSSFGEVIILVSIFFTLMLRNWHQPSNDSALSKSSGGADCHDKTVFQIQSGDSQASMVTGENNDSVSQLLKACSCFRNQAFINFLMDILQQLMHLFKSPANFDTSYSSNTNSGCGALLNVRRDLPSGNYSPFFSDSYAKTHQADMFIDYHRLLLENTFRLIYSLVRPEKHERTADKEKVYRQSSIKDFKLDNYQDVLCSYINNPNTTFVRRYARRLFLHVCGSKSHYYSVRDAWHFSNEVKKLHKHINKSGGHQNVVSYERNVKIVKCLSTMAEVAASRPRNWQKFCMKHADVLPFLIDGVFYFCEESVIPTLKLLNLAFYTGKEQIHPTLKMETVDSANATKPAVQAVDSKKKRKSEDGFDDKTSLNMEAMVDIFSDKDGSCLKQFIDCFLLEWNSSSVRAEAKCALCGAWHHGNNNFKELMLTCLLQRVKSLPMYGQNIIEFTELVSWLLGKAPTDTDSKHSELVDSCLTPEIVSSIFVTLHSQNELIANHPNSRIYNTLSSLVEFDGYYLESEPCVACSSPEVPYSKMKLESLKSETKFTDNRIIVKCTGSYTIQTVIMNVHDARKSKSVKVLNLYYNNRPVADLSELKNNWSLWKRAKSCHLCFNQTELKVEFPIPITACNFMIELDSFYENLQALSLEPLQCPRCSRPVTDKHGICSNCHENAYQCRQCRNINYENLDSFLCNECGYSKYGRFEFNFMARPSFTFDDMENDDDMKRGLVAIESESENAHRRYQQLLGFKKPLLKLVSSIGENEIDSQQKDSVQQMMVSLPGPSCKINRKIALLGVLYGEKCKAAFDSVSKSVQTLQALRRGLMSYLHQKHSEHHVPASRLVVSRSPNNCYGCATTFVTQCLEILQVLSKRPVAKKQLVTAGILSELFENNIHQGPKSARLQAKAVLCSFAEGDVGAVTELNHLIQKKVMYCLEHHRSMDIAVVTSEELLLLSQFCSLADEFWESRLRVVFQLLFSSVKAGAKHPSIAEHIILPCLRIISQACTSPKPDAAEKEQNSGNSSSANQSNDDNSSSGGLSESSKNVLDSSDKTWGISDRSHDIQLLSYSEWEKGASYIDFVRRQYKIAPTSRGDQRARSQRHDYLALKYMLRWKRNLSKKKNDFSVFEVGSWVTELILSACSQSIRSEMCTLISLLCAESSSRRFRLLNLLLALLPATLPAGESAAEYYDLLFKMIESEDALLFLTVRGCLRTICKLITQEVSNVESLERSMRIDISQGFILHKLVELLGKFLEVPNIRTRFMQDNLLSDVLEDLIVIRGLIVQKTKLISDCNRLLKDLLDGLLIESAENKRQFIRACICGLQNHAEERRGRTCLFILEQLCNLICPSKPESVYLLILNKAHTQEEFIRGSMTKNPYSSAEIGPLMRDVKNKICNQLELFGLLEDDYGMELLVAGNIISLDLSIGQVFEQVWKKSNSQYSASLTQSSLLTSSTPASLRECPPMTVTYRLQGLDGEATEPMIKELEEDREESQDPEVEFAIVGAVREYGGLEILLAMIQRLREDFKSNQEKLAAVLNVVMHCCKIKENRRALLRLGALALLLETARRAFSVEAMEPAEGILLIVESLTLEANESDNLSITCGALTVSNEESGMGEQAKKLVLMFLERLSHPSGLKKSNKQQRNTEMVARILPYLTYGEPAAMDALVRHFDPHLKDWKEFDRLQMEHASNPKDDAISHKAATQKFSVENFVRVSESLKTSSCGWRLKDIILEKGITGVAVKHLSESFGVTKQANFKSSSEWSSCLKLPSVPHILSMLRGLSLGHLPTQQCIDDGGVLFLLHALEGVTGENEIGARAENLLDTLSNKDGKGDGFLEEKVMKLRCATRDEMRRLALKKREELLQGLGMRQELTSDGGERIVVARPLLDGLDDVEEEEDGLACMVCREGYSLRPSDLLGVYSYSKRVNLGGGSSGSARGECVYTTVSYFNIIHFQCHQEAKRADAALKNPKKEWEGATLRNNESLCNSLFPVRGPAVPLAQYVRHVDQYWDNLNALGRADGSRLRLLIYDIVLMLARFATGASFSTESRGGGRESNSRFLPFMIQMARYLVEQGSPSQKQGSSSSYVGSSAAQGNEETVQFMMVNSLLTESYDHWMQHRRGLLQRGLHHAYMQHTHGRSSSRLSSTPLASPDDLLPVVRPMLVYTGLVEQLQRFLKVKKPGGDAGWDAVMKERLSNLKDAVALSRELLCWLDEMNGAGDMMEAFDISGLLPDALSGGVSKCEDFVVNSINSNL